jgi:hypothetical protein
MPVQRPVSMLAVLILPMLSAAPPRATDPLDRLVASTSGTWNCSSVSNGKTTTYVTTWSRVTGTRWLRGVNRSGTSQSIDMETYDTKQNLWRVVDMEPDGSMSVLTGTASDPDHITTQSHYPDSTPTVHYDRLATNRYTLTFDFILAGKPAHWVDDCLRQ